MTTTGTSIVGTSPDEEQQYRESKTRRPGWLPTVIMVAFFGYFMFPLAWLLISSTKTNGALFGSFGFWFSGRITCGRTFMTSSHTPTGSSSAG